MARGDAVVWPGTYRPSTVVDATLHVLDSLDHDVSRSGAHVAYIGSGEHPVRARLIGTSAIAPGATGTVRLHLPVALPLLPGDRYVLRESGRNETVGGGEILDVAPVRTAARARPDRSVDRVVAERGFVDADELELITGQRRAPTVGRWVADSTALADLLGALQMRIDAAGSVGLDTAGLDERDRAARASPRSSWRTAGPPGRRRRRLGRASLPVGTARLWVCTARANGDRSGRSARPRAAGLVVERDGLYFHPGAIGAAARAAALLHADAVRRRPAARRARRHRKYALPIVNELDGRGITRRHGDVRIAGPRLPRRGANWATGVADARPSAVLRHQLPNTGRGGFW